MSNNAFFIMALENIAIEEPLGRGDKIAQDLFITNDHGILAKYFPPDLIPTIGTLEAGHIRDCSMFVYGLHDIKYGDDKLHQSLIIFNLRRVQSLLDALWLAYDNSIDFNMAFLVVSERYKTPMISCNNLAISYSDSIGLNNKLTITREDLRIIRLNRQNIFGDIDFYQHLTDGLDKYSNLNKALWPFNINNRLIRFFYFINSARTETLLPIKITQYCIALECLFSTDNSELAHKISERTANFLSTDCSNKMDIYNNLKNIYKVRSAIVHGDKLNKKPEAIAQLSKQCDGYLRKAIQKIICDTELYELFSCGTKDKLEEYFLNLCMK